MDSKFLSLTAYFCHPANFRLDNHLGVLDFLIHAIFQSKAQGTIFHNVS